MARKKEYDDVETELDEAEEVRESDQTFGRRSSQIDWEEEYEEEIDLDDDY